MPMTILVTYTRAGAGHMKAAEALANYLRRHYPSCQVTLLDILSCGHPLSAVRYSQGYAFIISHLRWLWLWLFLITDHKGLHPFLRPVVSWCNRRSNQGFIRLLVRQNPQVVLSTHFVTSELAGYLKKTGRISSAVVSVITDFKVHRFWLSPGIDRYVVASAVTKAILSGEGIEDARSMVCGIPVDEKFLVTLPKQALAAQLGITADGFTVLVVTGSEGIGPLEEIVEALHTRVQLLVVCARNQPLLRRLNALAYPGVKVFGFVNNIHELMQVADLIITKPGGLTIAELLVSQCVPVFICAIPGQETGNLEVLDSYGIGPYCRSTAEITQAVLWYQSHPEELVRVRERINALRRPDAAKDVCAYVCQNYCRPSN